MNVVFKFFNEFTIALCCHFYFFFFSALLVAVGWETEGIKVWDPDVAWCRAGS